MRGGQGGEREKRGGGEGVGGGEMDVMRVFFHGQSAFVFVVY